MSASTRRIRLLEDIVRLRRAERGPGDVRDLVTVRSHLEQELGGTVSRALAARLLGVSQTALQRWIDAGDVPTVITPSGRLEVPIGPLVDLYEAAAATRASGRRSLHVLEPAIAERRARADALDPRSLISPGFRDDSDEPHDRAERRNRAYHAAVAAQLTEEMVRTALHQLWRWSEADKIDSRYAEAWERILGLPLHEVAAVLADDSEASRDLRQNSPFAGALSEPERHKILEAIR